MPDHALTVRQARELLIQVSKEMTGHGLWEPALTEVVGTLMEIPPLLRATATLVDQVDPAVARVLLNDPVTPNWLVSPADRARYVAAGLRSKADDIVGVAAKLRLST